MFSPLIKAIKAVFLAFISANPLSIILRIITSLLVSFFAVPYFFSELNTLLIKIGFFLLITILLEMIATKLQFSVATYGGIGQSAAKPKITQSISKELNSFLKRKSCLLFLYTSKISIENILIKSGYNILNFEDLRSRKIQIFDGSNNTVIACELEEYNKAIRDPDSQWLISKINKCLKDNNYPSATVVLSVNDLIRGEKDSLNSSFHTCTQAILRNFSKKLNFNLLIDNLDGLKGFEAFSSMTIINQDILGLLLSPSNPSDVESITKEFRAKFNQLLTKISELLIQNKIIMPSRHQLAYIFSQQIKYLQEPLERFLGFLALSPTKLIWQRKLALLLTVNFISSSKQDNTLPTTLREWQSCIEEIKNR